MIGVNNREPRDARDRRRGQRPALAARAARSHRRLRERRERAAADVERAAALGADAVLVGSALSAAPRRATRSGRCARGRGEAARVAEVKFCGLTRAEDARAGGAARRRLRRRDLRRRAAAVTLERRAARGCARGAAAPGAPARRRVRRATTCRAIAADAIAARLDVVQLHGDPRAADVRAMRRRFDGRDLGRGAGSAGRSLPEWTRRALARGGRRAARCAACEGGSAARASRSRGARSRIPWRDPRPHAGSCWPAG